MLRLWGAFCQTQAAAENAPKRCLKWCIKRTKMEEYAVPFLERGCAEKRFVL